MNKEKSDLIEKLKKLGLGSYESQAYLALLQMGVAEASEIALRAKIPMGRIYNVLSSLEELHLIRSQDTRPKKYGCVDTTAALDRLFENKQEELRQKEVEIKATVDELLSQLTCVVSGEPERNFWTVAKGEEALELVRESLTGAQKEILFFYPSRAASERIKKWLKKEDYSEIITALDKSFKKEVEVKALLNKDVEFEFEHCPVLQQLVIHLGSDIKLAAIRTTPFILIDRQNIMLNVLNPLNPDEIFAVINIKDVKLAEELREKFFTIWNEAEVYAEKKEADIQTVI